MIGPVSPSAIKARLETYKRIARMITDGLGGKPFSWTDGERVAYTEKARQMGVTLVTKTHLERMGYRLKRRVRPVGEAYFKSPISNYGKLYVLECQAVKIEGEINGNEANRPALE